MQQPTPRKTTTSLIRKSLNSYMQIPLCREQLWVWEWEVQLKSCSSNRVYQQSSEVEESHWTFKTISLTRIRHQTLKRRISLSCRRKRANYKVKNWRLSLVICQLKILTHPKVKWTDFQVPSCSSSSSCQYRNKVSPSEMMNSQLKQRGCTKYLTWTTLMNKNTVINSLTT